jgi:hypothetical protein
MEVFLAWSGFRSKAVATALLDWLPVVLPAVEPWMSQTDVADGRSRSQDIATKLLQADLGIFCVTRDNLADPWMVFEAGALSKAGDGGRVLPFLLDVGISELSTPLAQFEAKRANRDGVWDLICSINRFSKHPVEAGNLSAAFELAWPKLESKLAEIPAFSGAKPETELDEVPVAVNDIADKLFYGLHRVELRLSELVSRVESLDANLERIERKVEEGIRLQSRASAKLLSPLMMEEIPALGGESSRDPVVHLLLGSQFREHFPPLTELCTEAYRAISFGSRTAGSDPLQRLRRMAVFLAHNAAREEFDFSEEVQLLLRELPRFLSRLAYTLQ